MFKDSRNFPVGHGVDVAWGTAVAVDDDGGVSGSDDDGGDGAVGSSAPDGAGIL